MKFFFRHAMAVVSAAVSSVGLHQSFAHADDTFTLPVPSQYYTDKTSPDRPFVVADPAVKPNGFVNPPAGSGYSRYFNQKITWGPCFPNRAGIDCATVIAPLDWHNPDGQAITLRMNRKKATAAVTNPASPDVFYSPGGPGASAQNTLIEIFTGSAAPDTSAFSLIGLDVRGTGQSTPVNCRASIALMTAYYGVDWSPDTDAEWSSKVATETAIANQCRAVNGALLDHVSDIDVAYDYDMVRQLLGDQKFNYLGASFSTDYGAVYLQLYPQNVGRVVLDAPIDLSDSGADMWLSYNVTNSFAASIQAYAQWKVRSGLATSVDQVTAQLDAIARRLDANPIRMLGFTLTQTGFARAFRVALGGGQAVYPLVSAGVDLLNIGVASALWMGGEALTLTSVGMTPEQEALWAASWPDAGLNAIIAKWEQDAATMGAMDTSFGVSTIRSIWTAGPTQRIMLTGEGVPPFMVIGGTDDPTTAFEYSLILKQLMPSAVHVTREGGGHVSFVWAKNPCIDNLVLNYLKNGVLPADGAICANQ